MLLGGSGRKAVNKDHNLKIKSATSDNKIHWDPIPNL